MTAGTLVAGRCAIAMVWLYQGLWCKVLGRMPRHARVVEATPLFSRNAARTFLVTLGCFETFLCIWELSGRSLGLAAVVQIVLLIVMNSGGVFWARDIIPDAAGMLFQNFAFAVLIWICR